MDYIIYNVQIENNTNESIKIADLQKSNSLCIKDDNDVNYYAYLNELTDELVTIPSKIKLNRNIKFMMRYNAGVNVKVMYFNNILLNRAIEKCDSIKVDL